MDNFRLWLEADSPICWFDSADGPIAGPNDSEDCYVTLPHDIQVEFDVGFKVTRVKYPRQLARKEPLVRVVIQQYAEAYPDSLLDGLDLSDFLPNYREISPHVYQRFEPKPGETMGDGDDYEPDKQPDMAEYIFQRAVSKYGQGNEAIGPATGYVLPDGRAVQMGAGMRADDHRFMVPTQAARQRWGWPANDSDTGNMQELMRRSGAVRVHLSDYMLVNPPGRMTPAQKRAIVDAVKRFKIKSITLAFVGGRTYEFETSDHEQMERYFGPL